MRAISTFDRKDGTRTYRVRFRLNGSETSETFTLESQAERFVSLLELLGPRGALDQIYAEDQAGEIPTLDEYAAQHIASLTRATEGTRVSYQRIYRRVWSEPLGHLRLHQITRHDVAAVVNSLTATLSDKSIANAHGLLAGMMNGAVIDGHIVASPCRGVRLPRNTEHEKVEHRYLTHDEYDDLWTAMHPHFRPLLDMLAGTGMRWGEAEALKVGAIDLRAGTVRITEAAKWNASKSVREIGPPKSKKSRRTVTLPPEVVETVGPLLERRKRDELVFTMPRGGQLRHATFHSRYWVPACKAAGLTDPRPRIHDLRHSHVAWLIPQVPHPAVIQARLGHESITTTMDTYGHLMPELQAAAAQAASAVFAGRRHPALPASERTRLDP